MTATELQLRRTFTTAAVQYADHLRRRGQPDQAITVLAPAVKVAPDDALAWLVLGLAFVDRGDLSSASSALRQAVQHAPGRAEPWVALGRVLTERGGRDEPIACFRRALACAPDHLEALVRLATALLDHGNHQGAVPLLERALAQSPDHPGALDAWARLELDEGAAQQVYTRLQDILEPHQTTPPNPHLLSTLARAAIDLGRASSALPAVERALRLVSGRTDQIVLFHARAELCDATGDVDEAFTSWSAANELRGTTFDADQFTATIDSIIDRTRRFDFGSLPDRFDERIVLVVGCPRSGAAVLERIVAGHPDVVACGELDALQDVARAIPSSTERDWVDALPRLEGGILPPLRQSYISSLLDADEKARRYLDRMPANLLRLGLLARIAPGARVVVMERDPLAAGFSCFRQPLGPRHPWATRLDHIGAWIRGATRLLDHWRAILPLRFHTVSYEELVTTPGPVVAQVVDFLGLPAAENALETANPSSEGIHERSKYRWRAYGEHLDPLRVALGLVDQHHPPPAQAVTG